MHKKVLLRERKRHTARHVVSTPSVLAGGGGYLTGYPPGEGGVRVPPGGYLTSPPLPHGILGNVAKHYGIWVPPPLWTDRWMDGRTDACQNITFPRTPYAGGKNVNGIRFGSTESPGCLPLLHVQPLEGKVFKLLHLRFRFLIRVPS